MKKAIAASLIFAFILNSCDSGRDKDKAQTAILSIHTELTESKIIQQQFINKLTTALNTAKSDPAAAIDTGTLFLGLDSARVSNESAIAALDSQDEVDNEYKYKAKALEYCHFIDDLYKKEYPQIIRCLAPLDNDGLNENLNLLYPRLEKMKETGEELEVISTGAAKKYELDIVLETVDSVISADHSN